MFIFDDDYENVNEDDYSEKLLTSTSNPGLIKAKFQFKPNPTDIMLKNINENDSNDNHDNIEDFYNDYFVDYKNLMNDIVILEQPKSGYIVRSRPLTLSCKALNARKLRFKCNNKWIEDYRHIYELGTDQETNQPFIRSQVDINRQEVEANTGLGDYECRCYASAGSLNEEIRSETAYIKVAYIRKHFYQMPSSERVPEGKTVQLMCTPPDADPKAEIIWHKNGREIIPNSDPNLIIANDGNLIISAPRLTDSGNYTCEAKNLANKRVTDVAEIVVYVDGAWSPWSTFSGSCKIDCSLLNVQYNMVKNDAIAVERSTPKQRRTRTCNNPAPLNGGANCVGVDEEYRVCKHDCVVDGGWSKWSEWSRCNNKCIRTRKRECIAPPPSNGGNLCDGVNYENLNCTNCSITGSKYNNNINNDYNLKLSPSLINQNTSFIMNPIFLSIALTSFIFLLLLVIGLTVLLCKRKKIKGNNSFYSDKNLRTVLLTPEQTALLSNGRGPYDKFKSEKLPSLYIPLSAKNSGNSSTLNNSYTLKSAKSYNSGYSMNRKTNGSRAALIGDYSSGSNSGGSGSGTCVKTVLLRSESRSSADENYATLYDFVETDIRPPSTRTTTEEFSGSEHDQSATIVAAQVDTDASRIELKRSGVSLCIGDMTFTEERMIFLAVSDDVMERPELAKDETCLSSVIVFGLCETEPETVLKKPAVITFEHCASLFPRDNWQFILYADWGLGDGWEVAAKLGEENINTPVYVHLEREKIHIMTEQFGRFFLAGKAKRQNIAAQKRVRLAAFASQQKMLNSSGIIVNIRIYCVPEVGMAIENVKKQEEQLNGTLLTQTENFLMRENGSLCVCVEDINNVFIISSANQFLEITDNQHLWCSQNGLHFQLTVESLKNTAFDELSGRIVIYQKGNSNDRQILEFNTRQSPPELIMLHNLNTDDKLVSTLFALSSEVKKELISLFGPSDADRDWRGLCKKLGFDRFIQYFGTRLGCEPAGVIFDLWEATIVGSERAVLDLLQTLRVMGRPDAVKIIDDYLSRPQYDVALSV